MIRMDDYERHAASIRARISALRSSLAGGLESYKAPQAQRIQDTTERPKEEKRVEPRVEPDSVSYTHLTLPTTPYV